MQKSILLMIWIFGIVTLVSGCQSKAVIAEQWNKLPTISKENTSTLTKEQESYLQYLIQEEKLARDVYTAMYELRWIQKFDNILHSEDNHQEILAKVLLDYTIPNPTIDMKMGEFEDSELQKLYDTLVLQWKQSAQEALRVWITIENRDIADIESMITWYAAYPDISQALMRLLEWSKRHLAAFSK